jgi:predicted hydrocarbon binding protein
MAATRFKYTCAQSDTRQHKRKKSKKPDLKPRDRVAMDVFSCSGWLNITLYEGTDTASVSYKHGEEHVHYFSINMPERVKELVNENPGLTPTQVRAINQKEYF